MLPDRVAGSAPRLAATLEAYVEGVFAHPALPDGALERCRSRIAELLGAAPLGSADPGTGDDAATAACVAFAEQFLLDAQALDEVTVGRVITAVGETGYAVLAIGVGLAEGLVRAQLAWGVPILPVGAAGAASDGPPRRPE